MMCGMLRCCVPTCTTRLCSFCAAIDRLAFGEVVRQRLLDVHVLAGLARVDRDAGRASGRACAISTASTSLRASSSSCCLVANAFGSASFFAASRFSSHTSQTAVILTFGQLRERLHEVPAAPADADQADLERVVGGEPAGRFDREAPRRSAEEARNVRRSVVGMERLRWRVQQSNRGARSKGS